MPEKPWTYLESLHAWRSLNKTGHLVGVSRWMLKAPLPVRLSDPLDLKSDEWIMCLNEVPWSPSGPGNPREPASPGGPWMWRCSLSCANGVFAQLNEWINTLRAGHSLKMWSLGWRRVEVGLYVSVYSIESVDWIDVENVNWFNLMCWLSRVIVLKVLITLIYCVVNVVESIYCTFNIHSTQFTILLTPIQFLHYFQQTIFHKWVILYPYIIFHSFNNGHFWQEMINRSSTMIFKFACNMIDHTMSMNLSIFNSQKHT